MLQNERFKNIVKEKFHFKNHLLRENELKGYLNQIKYLFKYVS